MIRLEKTEVVGWEAVIRGMRNPMNSWAKSDSGTCESFLTNCDPEGDGCDKCPYEWDSPECEALDYRKDFIIGTNDHKLMMSLAKGGPVHAKYRRMITVYVDITAPLFWWKEFDTYKVGTVANSCSTMHKIHDKPFAAHDITCDTLLKGNLVNSSGDLLDPEMKAYYKQMMAILGCLNTLRDKYLKTGDKKYWRAMIEMLPSSYNQKRTVMMNYEVLNNIYYSRKNHKLTEWHKFCDWIERLPYSEIIIGEETEDESSKEDPQ